MPTYRRFYRLLAAFLIVITLAVAVLPGRALAGGPIGPRAMLTTYYGYINARQYNLAYAQWVNPPQTYADFVAGYNDTISVQAYFGGFQSFGAGSTQGCVPGLLTGIHADHGVMYRGYYNVRYNAASSGMGLWTITGANFQQIPYAAIDEAAARQTILNAPCSPAVSSANLGPQAMLTMYFDAVNRGDYGGAYARWLNPAQTYADFVSGWASTTETVMFYGAYQPRVSGVPYETGRVPVVLLGYHTDGSMAAYRGCLGVGYVSSQWGLTGATLAALSSAVTPSDAVIAQALAASCY